MSIKFNDLITLSCNVFSNNLCKNEIQSLIEKALIDKFDRLIKIDVSRIFKLIKSMSGYYIKREELCFAVKNFLETYLNAYLKVESGDPNSNEDLYSNRNSINAEFADSFTKVIANLSNLIWAFSKNEKFGKLSVENLEFKYFYSRLRDVFIKNIDYFNARELAYALKGIYDLIELKDEPINKEANTTISEKIESLESFTPHDTIMLLKVYKFSVKLLDLSQK